MAKSVKQPVKVLPYLKRVRVRDYAPLRDAEIKFKPGLNIIIGSNGAGKTRFLSLSNSLIELYSEHIDGAGCEIDIGGRHEIKALFKAPFDELEVDQQEKDVSSALIIEAGYGAMTVVSEILEDAIEDLINEPESFVSSFFSYTSILVRHGVLNKLPIIDVSVDLILNKRGVFIGNDEKKRRPSDVESRFARNILFTMSGALRRNLFVRNKTPYELIAAEDARKLIVQVVDTFLALLNDHLPVYTPLVRIERGELFQVYHNEAQDGLIIKGLVFEYYPKMGSGPLPFSALSDGTKRLLYIVTQILAPASTSFNHENEINEFRKENKIIFLEEPELGIHPAQLTKLLHLIREVSKENQVIMTTHSPQVLDMLTEKELDRITICSLDPKKGTQFHKLSRIKQAQAREYMKETGFLSDYWRYSFLEETETE